MALQVWLPLNGDLHNQGLSKITMTGTSVWKTSGKIGNSALDLSSRISFICSELDGIKYFSVCFWGMIEPNPDSTANWMDVFSLTDKSTSGITGYFRFETGYGAASTGGIHWHDNSTNAIVNGAYTYNTATEQNKWHHICVTVSSDKICSYYDGVLKQTQASNLGGGSLTGVGWIGESTTRGGIQDLRIYDHALSAKEVEEISKGLILHYKLDDSYAESSSFLASEITNTAYNSPISKYGYNETSNLGKVNGYFQGKYCTKVYTLTDDQTSQPYAYFSNLFTSDGTNSPTYKTLSFDYYTTVPTTTWLNIYKLGSGSGTATWKTTNSQGIKSGVYTNSSNSILVQPGEWNHVEVTFQGTTSEDAQWGYCINGPRYTSNSNYYFLYANIQLELNDHATGYGERMHSNIIYDSSGYENNGDCINISFISNTPRYNITAQIHGTTVDSSSNTKVGSAYIRGFISLITPSALTVTWWGKNTSYGRGGIFQTTINSDPSECTDYNTTAIANWDSTFRIYNGNTAVNFFNSFVKDDTWHYHTITFDGNTAKYYLDGVQKVSSALTGTLPTFNGFCLGLGKAGGVYRQIKESISDFRIYCTSLSAKQIKELYDTSATADKNGNMYGRELVE